MTSEQFLVLFASQFADEDVNNVTLDCNFRDLETWDSLTAMAILMMIQDEFNVVLTAEEFKTYNTVQEVYSRLNQ